MPCYLVRLIRTKELVGIFSCNQAKDLWSLVLECTEPEDCECIVMLSGGIIWPGTTHKVGYLGKFLAKNSVFANDFPPNVVDDAPELTHDWDESVKFDRT